ncbi:MAG: FG-GAP-like repeat-containing protein, partial [Saprospiraceae bacterium]
MKKLLLKFTFSVSIGVFFTIFSFISFPFTVLGNNFNKKITTKKSHTTESSIYLRKEILSANQPLTGGCTGCTITYNGTQNNLNLNSGDVFCIPNGFIFSGNINSLASGATICVADGATFSPSNLNSPSGTINNYGQVTFGNSISVNTGFTFNNYGSVNVKEINQNGTASFYNDSTAYWSYSSNLLLKNNSKFNNNGWLIANSEMITDNGTTFENQGRTIINSNFNPDGKIINYGRIEVKGTANINSNARVNNYCTIVVHSGIQMNGNRWRNWGKLFEIQGGSNDEIQINGKFINKGSGYVIGTDFTNNGNLRGNGNFYFTGVTKNNSIKFGQDGKGINFYDTGLPTNILDLESPAPHASVTKNIFTAPDTSSFSSDCSSLVASLVAVDVDTVMIDVLVCNPVNEGFDTTISTNIYGQDSVTITHTIDLASDTTFQTNYVCYTHQIGVYWYNYTNQNGCDSIVEVTNVSGANNIIINQTTCKASKEGTITTYAQNQLGCDSVTQIITSLDLSSIDTTYLATTTCNPLEVGQTSTLLTTWHGCDSLVINVKSLLPQSYSTIYDTICNETLIFNGQSLTTSGAYSHVINNGAYNGCDSTVTLHLYVHTEICGNGLDDDCDGLVDEFDTDCSCDNDNFFGQCFPDCEADIETDSVAFKIAWQSEGNVPNYQSPWVADIDNDGVPEVIIQSTNSHKGSSDRSTKDILIINGQDGTTELTITTPYMPWGSVGPIAIADIDGDGFGEIIISTTESHNAVADQGYLICYEHDGTLKWKSNTQIGANAPRKFGTSVGIADFNGDGISEVYVYNEIFNAQTGVLLVEGGSNGMGLHSNSAWGAAATQHAADLTDDAGLELACGNTVYEITITNTAGTSGNSMTAINLGGNYNDGFTSISDIDLDGELDIVVSEFGSAGNARVYAWNPRSATLIATTAFSDFTTTGYNFTGPAFIGDMDGDCQPEIGFTRSKRVYAYDYDGTTTLQQKWSLTTSDVSGLTGITMFDFNNDGKQELVYRDETNLRVLDGSGSTASNLFSYSCTSGTALEMPTVADVDADNQAEICVTCQTIGGQKGEVVVFETANEPWAYARQIWNQYGYNATNINDDMTIPLEPQNTAAVYTNTCGCNGESRPLNSYLVQATSYDENGCPIYSV